MIGTDQGQQSPHLNPNIVSRTRVRTLLYMFLLELMERIEHASDYIQQTSIYTDRSLHVFKYNTLYTLISVKITLREQVKPRTTRPESSLFRYSI